jgi:hypothetical protein
VTINFNPDTAVENAKWTELQAQLSLARERLLVVSAGHPRRHVRELALVTEVKVTSAFEASHWAVHDMQVKRDNHEWMDRARKVHADAGATLRQLIEANFAWSIFGRRSLRIRRGPNTAKPEIEAAGTTGDQPRPEP